jgi:uncharacterized membrane protein
MTPLHASDFKDTLRGNTNIAPHVYRALLVVLVVAFAVVSFWHQKQVFDRLYYHARDVSSFTQSLWNALQGRGFWTTIGIRPPYLFAEHLYLIQGLLLPAYHVWPSPHLLHAVSALAASLSGYAAYRVARALGVSQPGALLLGALLLTNPSLHGAAAGRNLDGYHPHMLFPVLFLLAYDAHLRRHRRLFWGLVLLSLATVEQHAIIWGSVGLYWWLCGERRNGGLVAAVALIWFSLATLVVIPYYSAGKSAYYFRAWPRAFDASTFAVLVSAGGSYAYNLIVTFAGLPFLSWFSLAILPIVLVYAQAYAGGVYNLPTDPLSFHAVAVLPVLVVAAAQGLARLEQALPALRPSFFAALTWAALFFASVTAFQVYLFRPPALTHEQKQEIKRLKSVIPGDAALAATPFVASHFSHRRDLTLFPVLGTADYVLIDSQQRPDWKIDPNTVEAFRRDPRFRLASDRAGFLLFQRTSAE